MTRPIKRAAVFSSICFTLMVVFSANTFAQEMPISQRFDVSAALRYAIPVGNEESGIKWSDAYENGIGGSFEIGFRANPNLAIHAGVSYDIFKGKEVTFDTPTGPLSATFSDQKPLSFYGGVKTYLLAAAPQHSFGINPYLRADVGATRFDKTDLGGVQVGKSSTEFAFGAGAGFDVVTARNAVIFLEAKYQIYGKPDQAGNDFKAIPLSVGLRYML